MKKKAKQSSTEYLTLEDARRMIRKKRAYYEEWYVAGLLLCISKRSTFEDLLTCLKHRAANFRAARVLHKRTGRPLQNGKCVISESDWRRYLKAEGKI